MVSNNLIGTIIHERYRLASELGRGGMGTVYRAHDTTLKRNVALKLLANSRWGTEGRARLLREAQTVANLHHPNIVVVHDAGEFEEVPFIVMELVEGQSLFDKKPEDLEEIVDIAKQICQALDHAHQQGVVHRDLKPENVMIEPGGSVRLMDFGLARSVASRMTSEGTIVGTVHYMAPEMALGKELDPRTDLYALGIMLYELTTGDLPFEADNPVAIITQHLNAPLVPPRAKREDLPPALNILISKLIEKQPVDRPASASEVLELLDDPGLLDSDAAAGQELYALDRMVRGRMVGRKDELQQATVLWQKAINNEGQLIMVSGEPGVGKTRLAREIITQAEVSGGWAFVGECHPEGNTPYSAFAQIVRRVLREHAKNGVEFPKAVLADMLKLSPELTTIFPEVDPNPVLDPEAEQRRLFEHMVGFCRIMSTGAPLLLLLEDLHWGDSSTLAMLNLLARRTASMPVMLLGTYREVELDVALPFHQAMQDLNRQNLGSRIKLERLDREQTKQLLATIFSEEITPEFLDGIYQETDGNPFFVEEVCKALIESGQLVFKDGRWDRPSMEELSIPQGVKVAIQSRITRLSEEAQGVMLFAGVIGRAFDYPTLNAVAGKNEDELIDCLEEALNAQLIEELPETGGEGFRFSHALIPFSLRDGISGLRRSRLHSKVAEAIEAISPDEYERLAHHWGEAGRDEKGLDYTIKAARRAQASYANQEAIRLYTDALALLADDHPDRYDMLAGRAGVYQVIGEYDKQRDDAQEMLAIAESGDDRDRRMDALLELAENSLATEVTKVSDYADQVIAIAEAAGDSGRLGRAYFLLGGQSGQMFDVAKAQEYLESADPLLREAGLMKDAAENLSYLSVLLADSDRDAALRAAEQALEIGETSGDRQLQATTTRRMAIALYTNYRFEEALVTSQKAIEMFREVGDRSGEMHATNVNAIAHADLRQFDQAERGYLETLRIAETIGEDTGLRFGVNNLMSVYNYGTGEYEKGLGFAEAQAERARQQSNELVLFNHEAAIQGQLYLMGQYQGALEIVLNGLAAIEKYFDLSLQTMIRFYLSELHYRLGDDSAGLEFFDEGERLLAENDFSPVREFYIWDAMLTASRLSPAARPRSDIRQKLESLIELFREQRHLQELAAALYSISRLHLSLAEQEAAHIEMALAALQEGEEAKKVSYPTTMPTEHQLYLHARAHRLAGQNKRADDYLKQARDQLVACAERITTPEYRRSYLEEVPENVAIQQDYQERFGRN
jgi:predicted ATPase